MPGNQQVDANYQPLGGGLPLLASKTIDFNGTSGRGLAATQTLFNVTGLVQFRLIMVCSEDVAGVGTFHVNVGSTNLLNIISAASVDNGKLYTPWSGAGVDYNTEQSDYFAFNSDITLVMDANVTDGIVSWYVQWRPVSADGDVAAL